MNICSEFGKLYVKVKFYLDQMKEVNEIADSAEL